MKQTGFECGYFSWYIALTIHGICYTIGNWPGFNRGNLILMYNKSDFSFMFHFSNLGDFLKYCIIAFVSSI